MKKRLCGNDCIDCTITNCNQCSIGQKIIDDYEYKRLIKSSTKTSCSKKNKSYLNYKEMSNFVHSR